MRKILIILTVLLATVNLNAKDMIKLKFNKCVVSDDKDTVGTVVKAEFNIFVSDDYMKVRCPKLKDNALLNLDLEIIEYIPKPDGSFYIDFLNQGFNGIADYKYKKLFIMFNIGKTMYSMMLYN